MLVSTWMGRGDGQGHSAVSIPHRDLCWFQHEASLVIEAFEHVSIPHRDLCWFQLIFGAGAQSPFTKVSIPHRDLCWFQPDP